MKAQVLRTSLVLRTTLVVLAAALLVGAMTQAGVGRLVRALEAERQRQALEALLDVVGPTASAACFAQDPALAQQIVDGLVGTPMVHGARLRSGTTVLAEAHRPGNPPGPARDRSRAIASPFSATTPVGDLTLTPDPWEAERRAGAAVGLARLVLAGLGLIMGLVLAGTVHRTIVQPITWLSRRLHSLDADSGGRLRAPRGHGLDEIGRLVTDVNALVQRLVAALWKEEELHQRLVAEQLRGAAPDQAGTGLCVVRADGVLETWSDAFARLLGPEPPVAGTRFAPLFGEAAAQVEACLARCLAASPPATATLRVAGPRGGDHRWLQLSLEQVSPGWCQGLLDDVSSHLHQPSPAGQPELRDAVTGALTGLGAEYALAERFAAGARGMAVARVDLEPVRAPADGAGPDLAGPVLREATARMTGTLRRADLVARLEGAHFLIIFDHLEDAEAALGIARNLVTVLEAPIRVPDGQTVRVAAALGLTLRRAGEAPSRQALTGRAEQALLEARAAGGHGCRIV